MGGLRDYDSYINGFYDISLLQPLDRIGHKNTDSSQIRNKLIINEKKSRPTDIYCKSLRENYFGIL